MSIKDRITKLATSKNIAEFLDKDELRKISENVLRDTKIDEDSRTWWMSTMQKGMDLAKQVFDTKNQPWPNASNIKYPLITSGAVTFAAREYPQLVRGSKVVEACVFGADPKGEKQIAAKNISMFQSWQVLEDTPNWETETDKLLHMLAVCGTVFRKIYWDDIGNKPIFELCLAESIIINHNVKSLEKARRVTHRLGMYKNDLVERINTGQYLDIDLETLSPGFKNDNPSEIMVSNSLDSDAPYEFLEQHCYIDLDDDGYKEPYIVLLHEKSGKIFQIQARFQLENVDFTDDEKKIKCIKPDQYFTDYHFVPSMDGGYYSFGYGLLLYPLNNAINTIFNQLIDSGTLANMQAGFLGSGCRIKGGEFKLIPGRWTKTESVDGTALKDNIVPLPTKEPSQTLFQLLQLLIDTGKELASVTDALQGNIPTQNSAATTVLMTIKQGLTQYSAIHKRVLVGFAKEFEKLYILNCRYLDKNKYLSVVGDPLAKPTDFKEGTLTLKTISDPNLSSDALRLAQAQAVFALPSVDRTMATKLVLESLDIPTIDINQLLPPNPPPPFEQQESQAKLKIEAQKVQNEAQNNKLNHLEKVSKLELAHKKLNLEMMAEQRQGAVAAAQIKMYLSQGVKMLSDADVGQKKVNVDAWGKALDHLSANDKVADLNDLEKMIDNSGSAITDEDQPTGSEGLGTPTSNPTPVQPSTGGQASSGTAGT